MEAAEALAVVRSLDAAGIRGGVSGGWGIDALLGRQTRPHGDLDLAVDALSVNEAIAVLGVRGYGVTHDQRPARLELSTSDGRKVDLHPVRWQPDGTGYQHGFDGQVFVYPPGSMETVGRIARQTVICATAELQLTFHAGYEPKPHDRADVALLAKRFGLAPPAGYTATGRHRPGRPPCPEPTNHSA